MGVQGLWPLLEVAGKPVALETLQGKRVAVDVSIWLHQAMHATGAPLQSPLITLFNRICKLLFYGIRPVFVFDGPAPEIKRRCLSMNLIFQRVFDFLGNVRISLDWYFV